ncbi:creatininase family protein [Plastoroseomonas arctica]|uniref:Creatininase family protein n=1 Tax=Plastoroseomonas arctica TaxID=1509237 RepID=A0AAF1K3U8_9PROT|nr:creatininase family protein [Plastoroseomonas arctica]MBR0656223.1 creatininase family protein [Plastoroseomonas arctica]
MSGHRIAQLTAPVVAARLAAGAAVLLPMGSTETHGPALPMGDYLYAEDIATRIAETAAQAGDDALVAPPVPFGGEDFFAGVPGGVSLTNDVLQAIVEQMAEAFLRTGTRRILVVNGHGGSIGAVDAAARAMRAKHGVIIATLHLWKVAGPWQRELGGAPEALGHGGDPIASVALHLVPTLCAPEAARTRTPSAPFLGLPITGFGTVACEGVEFAVPINVAEIADGGVQAADARGVNPAHGARIVARFAIAGAAMLAALRQTA